MGDLTRYEVIPVKGGRNSKYRANKASQNIKRQYMVLGVI